MVGTGEVRYYAEELKVDGSADAREQLQEALDAGSHKDWHLVGASDLPGDGVILFWDTARPSYGRSQYGG